MKTEIYFWILFLLINSLYFFPGLILNFSQSSIIPIWAFNKGPIYNRLRHLFIREKVDMFRVCIDFTLLTVLYLYLLREVIPPGFMWLIFVLVIGVTLAYQLYHIIFEKLYHLEPVLFNDHFMLKTAFSIFFHEFDRKNLLITLCGVSAGALVCVVLYAYVGFCFRLTPGTFHHILFSVLVLASLWSLLHYSYRKYSRLTFQSPLQAFYRNIRRSIQYRKQLARLSLDHMARYNPPDVKFNKKPNIFLILVESYGRILCDDEDFSKEYKSYMAEFEESLSAKGWKVATSLSTSPVTGGASWISYTSVLYGLKVRGQGVFLSFLRNKLISKYRSMFYWLKDQGYKTWRLSSLGGYETMDIPYAEYSRMYGIDHWIKYADLEYVGKLYGFGPSPPDQYALHFAEEKIRKESEGPFAVFFITQNSHTPYETPDEVVDDWRDLVNRDEAMNEPSRFWSRPKFELYAKAIKYQMEYLTHFILQKGREGDIFLLIGDHQPASLSKEIKSFETPVHVIAKNAGFLETFIEQGFNRGFLTDRDGSINHEAIYSIFQAAMLNTCVSGDIEHYILHNGIPYPE